MQQGTFIEGKEAGQQRIIQSFPIKQRQFTSFTSANGALNGPAVMERATGKVESGNYVKDQQHGEWKSTYINGKEEKDYYSKGKLLSKEDLAKLLQTPVAKKAVGSASQAN